MNVPSSISVFKRRTSKFHKRQEVRDLQASVLSPRIVWLDCRRWLAALLRMVCGLALTAGLVVGLWRGVEVGLFKNQDFRLRRIVLNDNPVLNEARLIEVAQIDVGGTLFECDPDRIETQLNALPEVARASVLREYPGDLHVTVRARRPAAWIASEEAGVPPRHPERGCLVDAGGVLFPVRPGLLERAQSLPVFHVRAGADELAMGEVLDHPDYQRGLRLLQVARETWDEAGEWIESIRMHKAWGSKLTTSDGIEATFGHTELERQMEHFLAAVEHARRRGDRIATISLVGRRHLPVTFHTSAPPRAIIVPEAQAEPPTEP